MCQDQSLFSASYQPSSHSSSLCSRSRTIARILPWGVKCLLCRVEFLCGWLITKSTQQEVPGQPHLFFGYLPLAAQNQNRVNKEVKNYNQKFRPHLTFHLLIYLSCQWVSFICFLFSTSDASSTLILLSLSPFSSFFWFHGFLLLLSAITHVLFPFAYI